METLNPVIAQLDEQIKVTPTVMGLHDEIGELKEGQVEIEERLETGFEKGRKRMDGIEEKVDSVMKEVSQLKESLTSGIQDIKNTIKDNEMVRLQKALDDRDAKLQKNDSRAWETIKILLTAIVSIGATYFLVTIGIK